VTIADREADIFEFLVEADDLEASSANCAAQDQRLAGQAELLWAHIAKPEVAGAVTAEVAGRRKGGTTGRAACASCLSHTATAAAEGRRRRCLAGALAGVGAVVARSGCP
jgi:hypothetical protein